LIDHRRDGIVTPIRWIVGVDPVSAAEVEDSDNIKANGYCSTQRGISPNYKHLIRVRFYTFMSGTTVSSSRINLHPHERWNREDPNVVIEFAGRMYSIKPSIPVDAVARVILS
jgi:hypothetical protein